jgi:putative membrane protein
MNLLLQILVSTAAVIVAAYIVPGVDVTLTGAIVAAIVLGVINTFIKPVVLILTLPLSIVTLGLFALVINALFVMLAAQIVPGFTVVGFWAALFFSIVLTLINIFFHTQSLKSGV